MTPAQVALAVKAAILVGLVLVGFGAGWTVQGWRLGAEVAELQGTVDTQKQGLATFEGANQRCVAGLDDVKRSVKGYVDAAAARTDAAAKAIAAAAEAARAHEKAAADALARPLPAAGKECEAMVQEALDMAKRRRGGK